MASPNARRPDAALTASRPPNDLRAGIATANKSLQAERQAEAPDFENPPAAKSSSGDSQNLKFERADWSLFRTIEGLSQKAGVPPDKLPRLVLKEIADNGLDAGARVKVGALPGGAYFVEDDGPGIDGTPEAIARLFSISRPMISTKLIRLPMRGALGNGLRVVAGAVLASGGSLTVITGTAALSCAPRLTARPGSSAPKRWSSRSAPALRSPLVRRSPAIMTRSEWRERLVIWRGGKATRVRVRRGGTTSLISTNCFSGPPLIFQCAS